MEYNVLDVWVSEWVSMDCWNDTEQSVLPLSPPQILQELAGKRTCAFLVVGRPITKGSPLIWVFYGNYIICWHKNECGHACRVFVRNGSKRTFFLQQSSCLEADSTLAGKEIRRFLWCLKCRCYVDSSLLSITHDGNTLRMVNRKKSYWIGHICIGTAF
jgi:hypothetical protein